MKGLSSHDWQSPVIFYTALGVLLYFSSLGNQFIFDDQVYIADNHLIKNFDPSGIGRIFGSIYRWDYLPLTLFTFSIDYFLYGVNPAGYHLTNSLLHLLNTVLLYWLVFCLTQSTRIAMLTGLLFLVHPVNVESVAWISERKNVLSLFFFLLSFNLYLRGTRGLSVLAFVFSCLSKSSVVVLPFLLMLHDFCFHHKKLKANVLDKLPYLFISGIFVCTTLWSHAIGETIRPHPEGNPVFTLFSMLVVFKEYLLTLLFPVHLNVWYPNQVYRSLFQPEVLFSGMILAAFLFLIRLSYKKEKMVFFGLTWFLISFLPVSHIVPIPQMMADRFLYIPCIGLFLALAVGWRNFMRGIRRHALWTAWGGFLALALVLSYAALSLNRIPVFKDDATLWQDSVAQNENNTISVMYLGLSYWGRGDKEAALAKLKRAMELEPENRLAAKYSAIIHEQNKDYAKAEEIYLDLISQFSQDSSLYNHLGVLYGNRGLYAKAVAQLDQALSVDPGFALAHYNRAVFLFKLGKPEETLVEFRQAVDLEPDNPKFQYHLGMFYLNHTDQPGLGLFHLEKSLRLNPGQPEAETIRTFLARQN